MENKNIWLLPTDKPSRLVKLSKGMTFLKKPLLFESELHDIVRQNIYITNSEEIKEGDYAYYMAGFMVQKVKLRINVSTLKAHKKIILTTDQDLIKDGVQAIDNEFLEWFVKNPSCESVEVENVRVILDDINYNFDVVEYKYKIIIPQEEPKQERERGIMITHMSKQETLEEVAERLLNLNELDSFRDYHYKQDLYNAFIIGIKYQQKHSYSEEEVYQLLYDLSGQVLNNKVSNPKLLDEWFEQFKKK